MHLSQSNDLWPLEWFAACVDMAAMIQEVRLL